VDDIDQLIGSLTADIKPAGDRDFGSPEVAALAVPALMTLDPQAAARAALKHRLPAEALGDAPAPLKAAYGRDLRLEQERDRFRGAQESTYGYVARRMLPGGSAVFGLNEAQDYADAAARFKAGTPEEGDYAKIAAHERLQQIEKERTTGESVLSAVVHVPAILGEGAFAGKALKAVGQGVRALRGVQAAAPVVGEAAQASRLARAGGFAGRVAATTPLMPSMYLAEAGRRAAQNGGQWDDKQNLYPAFAMGMATVAVLGSLQKFVTTGSFARKVAGKTALGMTEQQGVDATAQAFSDAVLEKAWRVETGYGLAGDVLRAAQGRENNAVKHALSQAAVFGIFSAMHSMKPREQAVERGAEIPSQVAEAIRDMKAKEYPDHVIETRARQLADALDGVQRLTPQPTREAAQEALKGVPAEFKPVAEKVAQSLPTEAELAKILEGAVDRTEFRGVLERTEQGREADAGRPALADAVERYDAARAPSPDPRAEPPVEPVPPPADPVAVLGEQAVRDLAAPALGLKRTAKLDTLLQGVAKSPTLRARIDLAVRRKLDETARRESPELPETARTPETAPGRPRIDEAARPPDPAPEGEIAPPERAQAPDWADAVAARLGKDRSWVEANAEKPLVRAARVEADPDMALRGIGTPDYRLPDARKMGAGHAVEFDVRNMKALAEALGGERAEALAGEFAEAVRAELLAAGAKEVRLYKVGGDRQADEYGALAKGIDPAGVELALARANQRIAGVAERAGVADLPHTKAGRSPGTGIQAASAEFKAGSDPRAAFQKASEASKAPPALDPAPSPLERMRAAQARRGEVKAPEPFRPAEKPPEPPPPDPLAEVLRAAEEMAEEKTLRADDPLRAALASEAAGKLTDQERYVLEARTLGKPLEQIARDGHADGGLKKKKGAKGYGEPYTRARVEQMEAAALKKLGLGKDAVPAAAEAEAQERAERLAAGREEITAEKVGPGEARAASVLQERMDAIENDIKRLENEFAEILETRPLTDAEAAEFVGRFTELNDRLEGRGPAKEKPGRGDPAGRGREGDRPAESPPVAESQPPPKPASGRTPWQEEQYQKRVAAEKVAQAEKAAAAREKALKDAASAKGADDTIRKWVMSEGGLNPKDLEGYLGKNWQTNERWAVHLSSKESRVGLDVVAEMAQARDLIPRDRTKDPVDVLLEALRDDARIGEAAAAGAELEAIRREQREREEWEEAVREGRAAAAEYKPSDEDIPFSTGRAAPPAGAGQTLDLVTPARLNAEVNAAFGRVTGARDYRGEPRLPGDVNARADLRQRATATSKAADQDPFVTLEEAAHHLSYNHGKGIETDPAKLPANVVNGLSLLNGIFGNAYPGRRNVVEGYASWAKLRAAGMDGGLAGDAKVAAEWAEKWTRDNGLMGPIDAVTPLFKNFVAQSPAQRAQGLGSSTGKPAEAARTPGEVAGELKKSFLDAIDNDLYPAERLEAAVRAAGGRVDPEKAPSTILAAARTGNAAAKAAQWARDGVPVMTADGRMQKHGPSVAEIEAGAKPEWLAPGPDGAASAAGAYHTARGIVSMRENGYRLRDRALAELHQAEAARDAATGPLREALNKEVARRRSAYKDVLKETEAMIDRVPEPMFETYRSALAQWRADPEFGPWAEAFSARLTEAFNAQLDLMASVGEKTPQEVQRLRSLYPDYTPTERVVAPEAGWNVKVPGKKGEKAPVLTRAASGSGEAIVDPLLVYKQRLMKYAEVFNRNRAFRAWAELARQPGAGPFLQLYEREAGTRTAKGLEKSDELRRAGLGADQIGRALKAMELADAEVYFAHEPWPSDGSKPTIEGKIDGKLTSIRVGDRALYELATNQQVDAHQAARLARAFAQFEVLGVRPVKAQADVVRTLATAANAGFQVRNVLPPRDPLTFWRNTIDRASVRELPGEYWKTYGRMLRQFSGNLGAWMVEHAPGAARLLRVKGTGPDAAREDPLWRAFVDARGDQLKQFAFERDNPEAAYNGIATTPTARSLLKDLLNVMGAGELAPRFLEWKNKAKQLTGKTADQLRAEYRDYYDGLKAGRKAVAPLRPGQEALLLNAAWEVTAPFPRQGVVTRQFNQITPFFGPAVAGVSKAIRNWKDNPRGALYALGLLAAARTLHWLLVRDEPWYPELSAHDKFNNFVVPTPVGPRRIPGPRDLDVAVGGTLVGMLDLADGKDPRFRKLLEQSTEAVLPPGVGPAAGEFVKGDVGMGLARTGAAPLGPAGTVGVELMMNRDWTGKPILPRREEGKLSGFDQFAGYYGPYALKQLTGGRGEASLSGLGLNPLPRVGAFRASVDDLYERHRELEVEKAAAQRAGTRFAGEREYKRLEAAKKEIEELARKGRGEKKVGQKVVAGGRPDDDAREAIMLRQAEVARRALGR
jgi:hypothetical protein